MRILVKEGEKDGEGGALTLGNMAIHGVDDDGDSWRHCVDSG